MQFLQPLFLWGTLAVAIPIALHFWHQKKGTVIAWAAMRFLFEKNQQPQRGLRRSAAVAGVTLPDAPGTGIAIE